ncbi:MAG: YD repeat-containing protein [Myxococcota bacterium]|jgi:YD repeat-containing protein
MANHAMPSVEETLSDTQWTYDAAGRWVGTEAHETDPDGVLDDQTDIATVTYDCP